MATTSLTQEHLKSLLTYNPDTGDFRWRVNCGTRAKAGALAGAKNSEGYIHIQICRRKYRAHRLAWLYTFGYCPAEIDHINRAKDDNRIANLRSVTHAENGQNQKRPSNNTSGHIGVDYHKRSQKWRARIKIDGKLKDIGYFTTVEEAAAARKNAEPAYLPFRTLDANH